MTAAVFKSADFSARVAEQHDLLVEERLADRLVGQFVGPQRRIPAVAQKHPEPPYDGLFTFTLARQRMLFQIALILRLDVDLQRAEKADHGVVECNRQRDVDDLLAAE